MYQYIQQLQNIATKNTRYIIGLMSGTSLDGLDVALCQITGHGTNTQLQLINFETVPYAPQFKEAIKKIFSTQFIATEKLVLLNTDVALKHAQIINRLLAKWQITHHQIDVIASHGQTIYHAPKSLHQNPNFGNATLQIGDGCHLAVATKCIVLSDFRQKHIAAGGEGAPLAVYGDYLIFSKQNENRILLNIGGIANFTYLPGTLNTAQIFSTDTGPGNTIMDAYMRQYFNTYFDADAALAKQGQVNTALLKALLQHNYFIQGFPKTTGPELFNLAYLQQAQATSNTMQISHANVMATLNKFSAVTIANAIQKIVQPNTTYNIFYSGGGAHNPLLLQSLQQLLPNIIFKSTTTLGINPDAKEAVLFALLGNECLAGNTNYLASNINGMPNVTMGKISFPA
jgi:anhydro-N-acetylmuramic acid kinase